MRIALHIDVWWHASRVVSLAGSIRGGDGLLARDLCLERFGTHGELFRKSTFQLRAVHCVVARIIALVRGRTLCAYRQENQVSRAR